MSTSIDFTITGSLDYSDPEQPKVTFKVGEKSGTLVLGNKDQESATIRALVMGAIEPTITPVLVEAEEIQAALMEKASSIKTLDSQLAELNTKLEEMKAQRASQYTELLEIKAKRDSSAEATKPLLKVKELLQPAPKDADSANSTAA